MVSKGKLDWLKERIKWSGHKQISIRANGELVHERVRMKLVRGEYVVVKRY